MADYQPVIDGVEMKVLGLDVTAEDEHIGIPLEALAVIKVLHEDHIEYRVVSTQGLTSVEGMGMIQYGDLILKSVWSAPVIIVDSESDDDEGDEPGDLVS
jgi:hypothetical protein